MGGTCRAIVGQCQTQVGHEWDMLGKSKTQVGYGWDMWDMSGI